MENLVARSDVTRPNEPFSSERHANKANTADWANKTVAKFELFLQSVPIGHLGYVVAIQEFSMKTIMHELSSGLRNMLEFFVVQGKL